MLKFIHFRHYFPCVQHELENIICTIEWLEFILIAFENKTKTIYLFQLIL